MCGIFFYIDNTSKFTSEYITTITSRVTNLLNHRGPDNYNYELLDCQNGKSILLLHTRLHIIGDLTPQPITNDDNTIHLIINGEIFNWKELSYELNVRCEKSDCEIIIPLYIEYVRTRLDYNTFFKKLNGQFSFVLYDSLTKKILVGRDHIGITPLYYAQDGPKIAFSSELKALSFELNDTNNNNFSKNISIFKPRSYMHADIFNYYNTNVLSEYLNYNNLKVIKENHIADVMDNIRYLLEKSVRVQIDDLLHVHSPEFGLLLSGGLDSSLIASLVSKICKEKFPNKKIKTFSIGMSENSSDLIAARTVAEFIKSEHYEFHFSAELGIETIKDVIWYTETYDTTTIRASTPMYLLTKFIKEKFPNIKILFSGELSDELFCYLYGGNAPNEDEYQKETIKLVNNVHLFDCLRSNKTCMANSIEVRVPFTDPDYVKYVLSIEPKYKIFGKLNNYKTMEKQILRDAFAIRTTGWYFYYLPHNILYRKKEAFSDGVSNHENGQSKEISWIDSIEEYCSKLFSDYQFNELCKKYKYNKPLTKEQLYYRETFSKLFNSNLDNTSENLVEFWKPNWCGENVDPSARKHLEWENK